RGPGSLDEPPHFFQFFLLDPQEGIEVFHFAGYLAVEICCVKLGNEPNAADAGNEILPTLVCADAQCADQSNSRHYDPVSHVSPAPVRVSGSVLQTLSDKWRRRAERAGLLGFSV